MQELAEDSTGAVVQDEEWEDSEPEETQEGEERQFWSVPSCGETVINLSFYVHLAL